MRIARMTLGEMLIANGFINHEILNRATALARDRKKKVGEALLEMGAITQEELRSVLVSRVGGVTRALRAEAGLAVEPAFPVRRYVLDPAVVALVPLEVIKGKRVLPIARAGDKLTVAIADPLDVLTLDGIQLATGLQVRAVEADPAELEAAIAAWLEERPRASAEPPDRSAASSSPSGTPAGTGRPSYPG